MLFVVAAFIEFAVLIVLQNNYTTRRGQRVRKTPQKANKKAQEIYDEKIADVIYKIDMVSLFVYASMFSLLNSLYWYKFSNWS